MRGPTFVPPDTRRGIRDTARSSPAPSHPREEKEAGFSMLRSRGRTVARARRVFVAATFRSPWRCGAAPEHSWGELRSPWRSGRAPLRRRRAHREHPAPAATERRPPENDVSAVPAYEPGACAARDSVADSGRVTMTRVDPRAFAVDRVLRDGGSIHVRAIRPDDKQRLIEHFAGLSARWVYFRFFRAKNRLTDAELQKFTELVFDGNVGLVATLWRDGAERIIGVGRFARVEAPGEPRRAEIAFAVADDHQGRGVASVLLEHLTEIARAMGIEAFEAEVLGENNSMLRVFADSGFRVSRALDAGVFHVTFPTKATD